MRLYMVRSVFAMLFTLGLCEARACDCATPQPLTFCHSLWYQAAPYRPDAVLLAKKLNEVHHGMDMQVVEVLYGTAADTIRVWGDPGHLCRPYVSYFATGDTFVVALYQLDGAGYTHEVAGDYYVSICGAYYLPYSNGIVGGPVFDTVMQQISLADFRDSVIHGECNPDKIVSVDEPHLEDIQVYTNGNQLTFRNLTQPASVTVYDATGRRLTAGSVDAGTTSLPLPLSQPGILLVEVVSGTHRSVHRIATGL